jgi:3-oxoacyl-[acyl-carrier protein] reductase
MDHVEGSGIGFLLKQGRLELHRVPPADMATAQASGVPVVDIVWPGNAPASGTIPVVRTGLDLSGRVAVVTGAGSPTGIGFAVCRRLGELGAAVALTATTDRVHDRVGDLQEANVRATGVVADLTDPTAAEEVVATATRRWGRVDIVVNNAGMVSVSDGHALSGGVGGLPYEDWQHSLRRNLDTAFLMTRAAVPAMQRVGSGWIATGSQTEEEVREGTTTPMGRSGTPDEIAWPVAWLCTPGAAYLTGQCLVVDGGNSVAEERAQ